MRLSPGAEAGKWLYDNILQTTITRQRKPHTWKPSPLFPAAHPAAKPFLWRSQKSINSFPILSHLYWLLLNPLERTEPQMCDFASPSALLLHPSLWSLVEAGRVPEKEQCSWQLLAAGKWHPDPTGQDTHGLIHPTTRLGPWNWGNWVVKRVPTSSREYRVFSIAKVIPPYRDPRSPRSAGKRKQNLVHLRYLLENKRNTLLINLLNS